MPANLQRLQGRPSTLLAQKFLACLSLRRKQRCTSGGYTPGWKEVSFMVGEAFRHIRLLSQEEGSTGKEREEFRLCPPFKVPRCLSHSRDLNHTCGLDFQAGIITMSSGTVLRRNKEDRKSRRSYGITPVHERRRHHYHAGGRYMPRSAD